MHKISQDLMVLSEQFCDFLALIYIATFSFPELGNDTEWKTRWLSGDRRVLSRKHLYLSPGSMSAADSLGWLYIRRALLHVRKN